MVLKKTDVCELLGIEKPIVQAAMGPYITTKLAAAVSNAGGMGIISHTGTIELLKERAPHLFAKRTARRVAAALPAEASEQALRYSTLQEMRRVKDMTDKPVAVNVRVPVEQPDAPYLMDAIIEEREKDPQMGKVINCVVTSAGNPALYTKKLKDAGIVVIHVVPSVYHAHKAVKAGCDAVVASGHEAGGHIAWDPVHTTVLLPAVKEAHPDIPVLSAGGWVDGKGLVAALALGAGAIYMGTRFICTKDSDFSQGYKEAGVKATERDTLVSAGSYGPIRIIKNRFSLRVQAALDDATGSFAEKFKHEGVRKAKAASWAASYVFGHTDNAPVLIGETIGRISDIPTVAELMDRILNEAEEIISKKLPGFIA
jgi:enoyl-[acyl-carrier protein] reductase II